MVNEVKNLPAQPDRSQNKPARAISFRGILLIGLPVFLIAAALYLGTHRHSIQLNLHSTTPTPITSSLDFSYSKLEDYELKTSVGKAIVTFKKPSELKALSNTATNQALLIHFRQRRIEPDLGRVAVQIVASKNNLPITAPKGPPLPPQFVKKTQVVVAVAGADKGLMKSFVEQRLLNGYQVAIDVPKAFKNSAIKHNAWIADFSASASKNKWPDIAGRVLMGYGKNFTYFFMVENLDTIWQSNQTTWQRVIDSLKIAQ